MTNEETAVKIVELFEVGRDHALAGEFAEAVECAEEAAFLSKQAHDEHRASFLAHEGEQ